MDFRTTFVIPPSTKKISYDDPVIFIGSCFATEIGRKFESGHMPVMINPTGTVYNPVSVINTLEIITSGKNFEINNLYNNNGVWLSFNHHTDFSSDSAIKTVEKINSCLAESRKFLSEARFLFITFGTARVYRFKETGEVVSNCHKIPAADFTNELLSVKDIVTLWTNQLEKLQKLYPYVKIVFTISPVRHWKDGAHGNQVSKSVLILAVEELLKHYSKPGYFPAYELFMDDLRDYRFYDDDLLHPSSSAVNYVWEAFTKCYFEDKTMDLWQEIEKISRAVSHRIQTDSADQVKKFAEKILSRIYQISSKNPAINLNSEKVYFLNLLEK